MSANAFSRIALYVLRGECGVNILIVTSSLSGPRSRSMCTNNTVGIARM